MSWACRRRRAAAAMPTGLVSFPFEAFMGLVGITCALPTAVQLDGTGQYVYAWFPDWVPYTWTALMLIGGVRALYGCWSGRQSHLSAGSVLVAMMVLVIGLAAVYHSGGASGWTTALMGVVMVFVSGVRSIYLGAVAAELRKVR